MSIAPPITPKRTALFGEWAKEFDSWLVKDRYPESASNLCTEVSEMLIPVKFLWFTKLLEGPWVLYGKVFGMARQSCYGCLICTIQCVVWRLLHSTFNKSDRPAVYFKAFCSPLAPHSGLSQSWCRSRWLLCFRLYFLASASTPSLEAHTNRCPCSIDEQLI